MMDFKDQLVKCVEECTIEEIDQFLVSEAKALFNTPKIYQYYQVLKEHKCKSNEARLIIAWMAQLSGDNMKLATLSRMFDASSFSGKYLSFYYDLYALSGLFGDPRERLVFSDKSLEHIDEEDQSFFLANAYLTRGQIHNGLKDYREAYQYFYQAFEVFLSQEMMFPASVSLTNALINKVRLGQFDDCIKIAKQHMLMSSSFSSDVHQYWDVLYFPMGMAYLEQNHVMLAIEYLNKAKVAIDALELIHMHGYLELYLFKAYKIHSDTKKLKEALDQTKQLFAHMRYPTMTQIIRYGDILHDDYLSHQEAEELKMMYVEDRDPQPFLVEMLVYLGLKNNEDYISFDEFVSYIDQLRRQGDLIHLQILLLLLADVYYMKNEQEKAKVILEEVLLYKDKYHLSGAFYLYPYESWPLIEKMDHHIKRMTTKQPYFTEKELEVLILMESGLSNKEIGEKLFISVGTVKWHINHILSKLAVKNRVQAVYEARKMGLFKKNN